MSLGAMAGLGLAIWVACSQSDSGTPSTTGGGAASVLQYHKSASRDGLYVDAAFTKSAAAKIHKDSMFTATIKGPTFAQPLYFEGGPGGKNLVIAVYSGDNNLTGSTSPVIRQSVKGGGPNSLLVPAMPLHQGMYAIRWERPVLG